MSIKAILGQRSRSETSFQSWRRLRNLSSRHNPHTPFSIGFIANLKLAPITTRSKGEKSTTAKGKQKNKHTPRPTGYSAETSTAASTVNTKSWSSTTSLTPSQTTQFLTSPSSLYPSSQTPCPLVPTCKTVTWVPSPRLLPLAPTPTCLPAPSPPPLRTTPILTPTFYEPSALGSATPSRHGVSKHKHKSKHMKTESRN
jgi:hypothetical protein